MRPLQRTFGKQHTVVGQDGDRIAPDAGKAAHQRRAIVALELVKLGSVDRPGDHLADVIGGAHIVGDDAVQLFRVQRRRERLAHIQRHVLDCVQIGDDRADDLQRVFVILGHMVDHARLAAVGVGAAQILGRDQLARRRLHQRRPGQEDGALVAHDHRLVGHGRHIGAPRRTAAHDTGDLGNVARAHSRLIEEDSPEMLAVGKYLGLVRQVGPARIDQIDARQPVLFGDLLRAQVLLHRHREIGAALHSRVIGDDHHLAPRNPAHATDHARAGGLIVIHAERRQLPDLEEGRAGIQQPLDPVAGQQLAAADVAFARLVGAAPRGHRHPRDQLVAQAAVGGLQRLEGRTGRIDRRGQLGHALPLGSFQPMGKGDETAEATDDHAGRNLP